MIATRGGVEAFNYVSRRRRPLRRVAKLFAAPIYYLFESGQFKSIVRARAVDRTGAPMPMFTYPAFDFLISVEPHLRDAAVLEFGCGQSTKWFAPRVKSLVGVEKNAGFREVLTREFAASPHMRFVGSELPFKVEGKFDIVVIDGEPRVEAGKFAAQAVADDGIAIFDNSDIQSLTPIPELFHSLGFARVDYFGYSPTGVRKQCTSIFFRDLKWFRPTNRVMPISANSHTENLR
jgi:hypothetical protein